MIRRALAATVCCFIATAAFAQATPDPHAGHTMPQAEAKQPAEQSPQGGAPVPPLTDEDRAAAFPQDLQGHAVHDRAINYFVLFDQLEWQKGGDEQGANWDLKAWIGGDLNRIWIHSEGATDNEPA